MLYPAVNKQKQHNFKAGPFNGGVNLLSGEFSQNGQLNSCENFWFSNGMLRMRPALNVKQPSIATDYYNDYIMKPLAFTGVKVYVEGKLKELAYMMVWDEVSHVKMRIFLVDEQGSFTETEPIMFYRVSSESFSIPETVNFFYADPTRGGGIYAFIIRTNESGTSYSSAYEISADYKSWITISQYDFYCPTIYINGRGNMFSDTFADSGYFPEPIELEQLNLLYGEFNAYFSSDGYSSSFQLPISSLDDSAFICRVYRTPSLYTEWVVPAGSSEIETDFLGYNVKLTVDRSAGSFSFSVQAGDYAVPCMTRFRMNNIKITAYKTVADGYNAVASSTGCIQYNSRLYMYGNRYAPNEIVSARLSNPLYFTKSASARVGDKENGITALAVQSNRLIAFKRDCIYSVNVEEGQAYSENEIIIGVESTFYKKDTLTSSLVSNIVGCLSSKTVKLCGNRLVWLGSDGCVYTLTSSNSVDENRIYTISPAVEPLLNKLSVEEHTNTFAATFNGYYFLFANEKILILDYRVKGFRYSSDLMGTRENVNNLSWYIWSLPTGVAAVSAACMGKELTVAVQCGKQVCAFADFSGNIDRWYKDETEIISAPLTASFTTPVLDFGTPHIRKMLNAVYITASGEGELETVFNGESTSHISEIFSNKIKTVKIRPDLHSVTDVYITVKGQGNIAVSDITFSYKNSAEVR